MQDLTRGVSIFINKKRYLEFEVSNAFVKLYEILKLFKLIPKNKDNFNSFHLAEAPGQFVNCLDYFIKTKRKKIKNFNWYATSLNPKNKENIKKYGDNIF